MRGKGKLVVLEKWRYWEDRVRESSRYLKIGGTLKVNVLERWRYGKVGSIKSITR